jgi:signal transduction histidine kinase
VHNTVSTAVTVIVLQAAGASRVADTDLARVREALAHIQTTARQAMEELRRLLGLLKASDPAHEPTGIGDPQPGLADLNALLDKLSDTGMPVTLYVEGAARSLDRSVDLAAYRIVQEGLTNALKYGGEDSNPCLRLIWDPHRLHIQIDNDISSDGVRRRQTLACGHGLDGLREQAQAVGGDLRAGPHHTNGWRVAATLPVADPVASPRCAPPATPRVSDEERRDKGKVSA